MTRLDHFLQIVLHDVV